MPEILELDPDDAPLVLTSDPYGLTAHSYPAPAMATQWASSVDTEGAVPATQKPENREVTFTVECTTHQALTDLQAKIGQFQREGGIVRRTLSTGESITFDVLTRGPFDPAFDHLYDLGGIAVVSVSLPCKPYARSTPLENITDSFAVNSIADYTFDGGVAGDVSITGGVMDAVANLTTEKRFWRSASPYDLHDRQHTLKHTLGTTLANYKAGVWLKRTGSSNGIVVYVDDNGTSSRLRIDKIVSGTPTNLASVTLGVRMLVSTAYWVRGRIEGNVITAEHWTSAPTMTGAPTQAPLTHTLVGGDATAYGLGVGGAAGVVWSPQQTAASLDDFTVEPNVYRGSAPLLSGVVYGVAGDVDADGTLIITDGEGQDRRYVAWGGGPDTTSPVILDSDSLVTAGFGGVANTRTGAYDPNASGNNVIRASVTSVATSVCGTGTQTHRGTYRAIARVYADAADTQVRLVWQDKDGQFAPTVWVTVPQAGQFIHVDLGIITITAAIVGAASWTGRIEGRRPLGAANLDIDFLAFIPATGGYGVARAVQTEATGLLSAYDKFAGTTAGGNLNARVPPLGAAWATSGVATDFQFSDDNTSLGSGGTAETVKRATNDAGFRFAVFGPVLTNQQVEARTLVNAGGTSTNGTITSVVARWVDASNHLRASAQWNITSGVVSVTFSLEKVVAGVTTTLASALASVLLSFPPTIQLQVYASGRAIASLTTASFGTTTLETTDAVLATGGALDDGLAGIADDGVDTIPRYYDDVIVVVPTAEPITMYSGRDLQVRHDSAIRANAAGTLYGVPASYRGDYLQLAPNDPTVVVAHANRVDLDTGVYNTIDDILQTQVLWTPRYLVVPEPS